MNREKVRKNRVEIRYSGDPDRGYVFAIRDQTFPDEDYYKLQEYLCSEFHSNGVEHVLILDTSDAVMSDEAKEYLGSLKAHMEWRMNQPRASVRLLGGF